MKRLTVVYLALIIISGCCSATQQLLYETYPHAKSPTLVDRAHDRGTHGLKAGAATVDITSPFAKTRGIFLGGFDQGRRNEGVRDPVFAHCLYLDSGTDFVVFVEIDTIGIEYPDVRDIQKSVSLKYPSHIIVSAAHDHVGPDTIGFWGPPAFDHIPGCSGRDEEYMKFLKAQVKRCVEQAVQSARPARLRFARAQAPRDLSRNLHPQIIDEKDDQVRVMQVVSVSGKPIAIVVNYGNHAEAMWNDKKLSADWPGVMYRELKDLGTVVFIQGALGGLVTVDPGRRLAGDRKLDDVFAKDMPENKRVSLMNKVGRGVAHTVREALSHASRWYGPKGCEIRFFSSSFVLPNNNWVFSYMAKRGLIKRPLHLDQDEAFETAMALVEIVGPGGPLARFVTIPGEPAPDVGKEALSMLKVQWPFIISLGLDEVGYILNPSRWNEPYYRYERSMSAGKDTANIVFNQIHTLLKQATVKTK